MIVPVSPDMPPPAPRPFRLRAVDAVAWFKLLFGGIWLTVGGIISIVFTVTGGPFWNDVVLDRRGVRAEATLGTMEATSSYINRRRVHRVLYVFTDRNGVEQHGVGQTTEPWRFYAPNLTIEYDPQRPQVSRISGERSSVFGLFVLLPVGFAAVGAIVFGLGMRRVLAVRSIYVHGTPARAEVTAVSPTAMMVNRRRVMRVDYTFDTIMGRTTGRTSAVDPPAVGSRLWVLHLPSEPKRNVAA
jgi:hypothetical protein